MAAYQANGAQLGWRLIPEEQALEIWPASGAGEPQRIQAATELDAGALFPGLRIDLEEIWTVRALLLNADSSLQTPPATGFLSRKPRERRLTSHS